MFILSQGKMQRFTWLTRAFSLKSGPLPLASTAAFAGLVSGCFYFFSFITGFTCAGLCFPSSSIVSSARMLMAGLRSRFRCYRAF